MDLDQGGGGGRVPCGVDVALELEHGGGRRPRRRGGARRSGRQREEQEQGSYSGHVTMSEGQGSSVWTPKMAAFLSTLLRWMTRGERGARLREIGSGVSYGTLEGASQFLFSPFFILIFGFGTLLLRVGIFGMLDLRAVVNDFLLFNLLQQERHFTVCI
jgi:hypothetical protein